MRETLIDRQIVACKRRIVKDRKQVTEEILTCSILRRSATSSWKTTSVTFSKMIEKRKNLAQDSPVSMVELPSRSNDEVTMVMVF